MTSQHGPELDVRASQPPVRWRLPRIDVTTFLSIWLAFLFGISAQQVVPGFGAIGSPALLLLLPAALWWFAGRAVPSLGFDRSLSVTRVVLLLHAWYLLLTIALAWTRPLTALERTGSIRAAITTLALTALALLVLDGTQDITRLSTLLRRIVWAAAFMGLVGVLQFFTGDSWQLPIPGLRWNTEALGAGVETRSIFNRPRGTAMHPIEFSVVTAGLLPLAIHFAMFAQKGPRRQAAVIATILIALGIPFAISRSGIVAIAVALPVLFLGWTWRQRFNGALVAIASVPILWLLVPGIVGTIRGMFTWFDEDPSIQSRRERLPRIIAQFKTEPWFGLGRGTWSIEDYFLIDNQFYVTALETGAIGVIITLAVIVVGAMSGLWAASLAPNPETRHLGRALTAGITAVAVSTLTFDAFHYRILTGVLFLLIGATGALLRLTKERAP